MCLFVFRKKRPHLQQGVLAAGDDHAELEHPDVPEEALKEEQIAKKGYQAHQ